MSSPRSVASRLTAAVLVAGLIGCAAPQSGAPQAGEAEAFDERIASLNPAEREELQRSVDVSWDYDAETRAARDASLSRVAPCEVLDAQQRALETRMEDLPPQEWLTYGYMPLADPHDP